MSRVSLKSNASGTGTFTIESPNSNTDRTLTLPDAAGAISLDGPCFSAFLDNANTNATHNDFTVIPCNYVKFNVGGFYNASTYRFTPTIAGYYNFTTCTRVNATVSGSVLIAVLGFNGDVIKGNKVIYANDMAVSSSFLVYMNGTTDYVTPRIFYYDGSGTARVIYGSTAYQDTYFQGYLVRRA